MSLRVSVVVALKDRQEIIELELPEQSRVSDALEASRVFERFPELRGVEPGIWSRRCAAESLLRDGDRIELYRPLQADPKQMRRSRASRTR